ncbi:MAG: hypothetical protein J6036_01850, partial [Clostridia bacterium]|nr:hypothetical protein [Clostridia bacterium]
HYIIYFENCKKNRFQKKFDFCGAIKYNIIERKLREAEDIKKIFNALRAPGISTGYLYFYVHAVLEIVCYAALARIVGDSYLLWTIPLLYDAVAFLPQAVIGRLKDAFARIPLGLIGLILLIFGFWTFSVDALPGTYTEIFILSLGNACLHVAGAEATLHSSYGKLSHSAIFVSGGSLGGIAGKLLGKTGIPFYFFVLLALTTVPFIILAEKLRKKHEKSGSDCRSFNYHNPSFPVFATVITAVIIVAVRSYMGYGIPTSWNKTAFQTVLLYAFMCFGKAFGGVLCDAYGIKKTALISIIGALPFLLFGNDLMIISLIGIMLFSMTMPVTLGVLVSALPDTPGLAFGLTTVGLFFGALPIFFIRFSGNLYSILSISVLSILCLVGAILILPENKNKKQ